MHVGLGVRVATATRYFIVLTYIGLYRHVSPVVSAPSHPHRHQSQLVVKPFELLYEDAQRIFNNTTFIAQRDRTHKHTRHNTQTR